MKKLLFYGPLLTCTTLIISCSKPENYEPISTEHVVSTESPKVLKNNTMALAKYIEVSGVGNDGQGADVKISDINGNGIPDILLMAVDNPAGQNSFRYKFLMDINPTTGTASFTTNVKILNNGMNEAAGAAAAIGDIDRNGIKDLLLMAYDNPSGANSFKYFIGWNLNSNGDVSSWSGPIQIAGVGDNGSGAGAALADIDQNGTLDLVLLAIDPFNAIPEGYEGRYKVGFNLNTAGIASTWTSGYKLYAGMRGPGFLSQGGGMDILDIFNNGQLYMVVTYNDHLIGENQFMTYLQKIDNQGNVSNRDDATYLRITSGVGQEAQGAGIGLGDIDRNGRKDFVYMAYDAPPGANTFRYYINFNIFTPHLPYGDYSFERCSCD